MSDAPRKRQAVMHLSWTGDDPPTDVMEGILSEAFIRIQDDMIDNGAGDDLEGWW
jgi:hypothetical protein